MSKSRLIERFQQQVAAHPHKVAILNQSVYGNTVETHTYQELNNCVNRLAHYLRQKYKKMVSHLLSLLALHNINSCYHFGFLHLAGRD